MNVRDMLNQRHSELKASIAAVEQEIQDIETALKAIGGGDSTRKTSIPNASAAKRFTVRHSMPVNDAVIIAVKAGRKTPVAILDYVRNELNIDTTISSIRSRVSPLGKKGKIAKAPDGSGWIPVSSQLNLVS